MQIAFVFTTGLLIFWFLLRVTPAVKAFFSCVPWALRRIAIVKYAGDDKEESSDQVAVEEGNFWNQGASSFRGAELPPFRLIEVAQRVQKVEEAVEAAVSATTQAIKQTHWQRLDRKCRDHVEAPPASPGSPGTPGTSAVVGGALKLQATSGAESTTGRSGNEPKCTSIYASLFRVSSVDCQHPWPVAVVSPPPRVSSDDCQHPWPECQVSDQPRGLSVTAMEVEATSGVDAAADSSDKVLKKTSSFLSIYRAALPEAQAVAPAVAQLQSIYREALDEARAGAATLECTGAEVEALSGAVVVADIAAPAEESPGVASMVDMEAQTAVPAVADITKASLGIIAPAKASWGWLQWWT